MIGLAVALAAGPLAVSAQNAPSGAAVTVPPGSTNSAARNPVRLASLAGGGLDFRVLSVLDEKQRASLAGILQQARPRIAELETQIRLGRNQLLEAELKSPYNEAAVRQAAAGLARTETDLAVQRARMLSEMQPPLTTEQVQQIKNPPRPNIVREGQVARPSRIRGQQATPSNPGATPSEKAP